jgi:hypothetical protein
MCADIEGERETEGEGDDDKRDALAISRLAVFVAYNHSHNVSNGAIMLSCRHMLQLIVYPVACSREVRSEKASVSRKDRQEIRLWMNAGYNSKTMTVLTNRWRS